MLLSDKEENPYTGYKFIKRFQENGAVKMEIWKDDPNEEDPNNQWKKIGEWNQAPKREWKTPPSDHQETLRDDLGLFGMLNNFDKVKEKFKKGQKQVYQDGWSIKEMKDDE